MRIHSINFSKGHNIKLPQNKAAIAFVSLCLTMFMIILASAHGKLDGFLKLCIGLDVSDPLSVMAAEVGIIDYENAIRTMQEKTEKTVVAKKKKTKKTKAKAKETLPILSLDLHPKNSTKGYLSSGGVLVKNHTKLNPNISSLLATTLSVSKKKAGPRVLIVHTHSSEAYKKTSSDKYAKSDPARTQDMNYTVMRVGKEMMDTLNRAGVPTIQDRAVHDYPSYNGSYASTLESTKKYLKKYPSIECVIDVHRDAMQRKDGTRLKGATTINDESVAQIMIVSGTNQTGLAHPHWHQGLAFACKFQKQLNTDYKSLTRPIDLREERFNMHTTKKSIILEVGSVANTLDEAILAGKYSALSLAKLLK
jgi:stage II sporulation protein P